MDNLRIKTPPKIRLKDADDLSRGPKRYKSNAPTNTITKLLRKREPVKAEAQLREDEQKAASPTDDNDEDKNDTTLSPQKAPIPAHKSTRSNNKLLKDASSMRTSQTRSSLMQVKGSAKEEPITWEEDSPREGDSEFSESLSSGRQQKVFRQPPVLFDPVEDRIRSRWLPVLALCLIPTVFSTVFMVDLWDTSAAYKGSEKPTIVLLFQSGDPFILNRKSRATKPISLRALNSWGWPLQGVSIKARIADRELAPRILRIFPWCSSGLELTSNAAALKPVCDVTLDGSTEMTDEDGVATFDTMTFSSGLPGSYQIAFEVPNALKNYSMWVTVKAGVTALEYTSKIASGNLSYSQQVTGLPFSLAIPTPTVRVITVPDPQKVSESAGSAVTTPLSNIPVIAIALDPTSDQDGLLQGFTALTLHPDAALRPHPIIALSGNLALTASDGTASFTDLSVAGYDRPALLLAFVCHGQVLVWSASRLPKALNLSEAAASSGGEGAFPTFYVFPLPVAPWTQPPLVTVSGVPGQIVEGVEFVVSLSWPSELQQFLRRGAVIVAHAVPVGSAYTMAAASLKSVDAVRRPGRDPNGWSPRFKELLSCLIICDGGLTAKAPKASFSLFGAVGEYSVSFHVMGVVVATAGPVRVLSSVGLVLATRHPGSRVICGESFYPVCRQVPGACSFGNVSGNLSVADDSTECDGARVLEGYTYPDQLPAVQLLTSGASAPVSGKAVSLVLLPWPQTAVLTAQAAGPDPQLCGTSEAKCSTPYTESLAPLTNTLGTAHLDGLTLRLLDPAVRYVQPVVLVDTVAWPIPVKITVVHSVAANAALCNDMAACAHLRVLIGVPLAVVAGQAIAPAPAIAVLDGAGSPLAFRLVCAKYGGPDEISAAASDNVYYNSPDLQAVSYNILLRNMTVVPKDCSVSNASGIAVFTDLRLSTRSDLAGFGGGQFAVWFYSLNSLGADTACLASQGVWSAVCRSLAIPTQVVNNVSRIDLLSGPAGTVYATGGAYHVEAPAGGSSSNVTVSVKVACYTQLGQATGCGPLQARLAGTWNSMAASEGTDLSFVFKSDSAGLAGSLQLTFKTGYAGIYQVALSSNGVRSAPVFIRLSYTQAAMIVQASDRNAIRNGSYESCVYDCGARNVSNIGRIHPQEIRIVIKAADGSPVFGAQAFAELVSTGGQGNVGQISGAVSEPLGMCSDGVAAAVFPRISVSACTPGTYRFKISLYGPWPFGRNTPVLTSILTEPFIVRDQVVLYYEQQPPENSVAGGNWMQNLQYGGVVGTKIVRWDGNTAFMYDQVWVPPVFQVSALAWINLNGSSLVQAQVKDAIAVPSLFGLDGYARGFIGPISDLIPTASCNLWKDGGITLHVPFGIYSLAISGVGMKGSNDSVGAEGADLIPSRPFRVTERAYGIFVEGHWPAFTTVGQSLQIRVRVSISTGAPLEGQSVQAQIMPGCRFSDQSCVSSLPSARILRAIGVTDEDGVALVNFAVKVPSGLYNFIFMCGGALSLETPLVYVQNIASSIRITGQLIGNDNGAMVPTRSLTSIEFQVAAWTNVGSIFNLRGDISDKTKVPAIQVLDAYGSVLLRSKATGVDLRIVTCNGSYVPNGTVYPPTSQCAEYLDWTSTGATFVCVNGACEGGSTQWQGITFAPTTPTGFYYVFFLSDGIMVAQKDPLYIQNVAGRPTETQLAFYRLFMLVGSLGGLLLTFANLEYRDTFWSMLSLIGAAVFLIITILYFTAMVTIYGYSERLSKEQIFVTIMLVVNVLLVLVTLLRHVLFGKLSEYFSSRQIKYLAAIRDVFASPKTIDLWSKTSSSRNSFARVYPAENQDAQSDEIHSVKNADIPDVSKSKLSGLMSLRSVGTFMKDKGPHRGISREAIEMALSKLTRSPRSKSGWSGRKLTDGFQFPSRLLQGFGVSVVVVVVLIALLQSSVNWALYRLAHLRSLVVAYRGSLGMHSTTMDTAEEAEAIPTPPYSNVYDASAITYTVLESFYGDGRGQFDRLSDSIYRGSLVGCITAFAAFSYSWVQSFRAYRRLMSELRQDVSKIDHWKYPIHEAAGYVGKQAWSCAASVLLVYSPVALCVYLCSWDPTQRFFLAYIAFPLGCLVVVEAISLGLRAIVNRLAVERGYICNRRLFGIYDFLGLYLHFVTGISLAVLRLIFTYSDFAVSFQRLDLPVIEGPLQNWDPGHSSFMAMLYLDYVYNAPVTSVLAHCLSHAIHARRATREAAAAEPDLVAGEADGAREAARADAEEVERQHERIMHRQRVRWQFLYTQQNNPGIRRRRVFPPPPVQPWEVDDDSAAVLANVNAPVGST